MTSPLTRAPAALAARERLDRLDAREVLEVHARVLVARRARRRGRPSSTREIDGIPASPSRAETAPSCITPSPDSAGSSSCRAITPPHSRWYWSALRSIPAETTGLPSSVKPSAPASRSSAISVSSSPLQAAGDRGQEADRDARLALRARRSSEPQHARRRRRPGSVLGIAITAQKPPAAAARGAGLEVLLVLLAGGAQVDVRVDEAGNRCLPVGVDRSRAPRGAASAPGAPSSAIWPSRIEHVVRLVEPGARIEHVGAADQQLGGRRVAVRTAAVVAHARHRRQDRRADEQLVEDRHPHRDPGLDLLADQRLRRVDRVGRQLDAAVDRAGVHEQLARAAAGAALIW